MKRLFNFLAIIVVGITGAGMVSCQEEEKDGLIGVNPSSLEFLKEGGTQTISVEGLNWTATPNTDWITVETAGSKISVTVGINETGKDRSGSITVKNNEDTKTVAVTQKAAGSVTDPALSVDPEELPFTAEGGTETVTVTSELAWTAAPNDAWITVEESDGSFTVTVVANDLYEPRTGSVTVDNGENEATVTVTQEAAVDPSLRIDPEELPFTAEGGTETVTVTSTLAWTATPNDAWITVEESGGSFTVTVVANELQEPRTGSVTVDNGQNTETLAVTQEAVEADAIDELVGTYTATGIWLGGAGSVSGALDYKVTATKVDATTLLLSNFFNLEALSVHDWMIGDLFEDDIEVTFDPETGTITIPHQTGFEVNYGSQMLITATVCPFRNSTNHNANFALTLPVYTVARDGGISIDFEDPESQDFYYVGKKGSFDLVATISGMPQSSSSGIYLGLKLTKE